MYSSCPCVNLLVHLKCCWSATTCTPKSRHAERESCRALQPVRQGLAMPAMTQSRANRCTLMACLLPTQKASTSEAVSSCQSRRQTSRAGLAYQRGRALWCDRCNGAAAVRRPPVGGRHGGGGRGAGREAAGDVPAAAGVAGQPRRRPSRCAFSLDILFVCVHLMLIVGPAQTRIPASSHLRCCSLWRSTSVIINGKTALQKAKLVLSRSQQAISTFVHIIHMHAWSSYCILLKPLWQYCIRSRTARVCHDVCLS